jgi:HK97 family phage portal protein
VPLPNWTSGFGGTGTGGGIDPGGGGVPFYLNAVVAACVGWLARNFPVPDLHVVRVGGDDDGSEIEDHPLVDLFDRPNEVTDFFQFFCASVLSDVVAGNTFWLKRKDGAGRIVDLWVLNPWAVAIIPDPSRRTAILRYEALVGDRLELYRPDEIVHVKNQYDPVDPRRGLAPLAAAARSVRTIDRMELYDERLMTNCGAVPVILSPTDKDDQINREDARFLRDQWRENQSGSNTGLPLVSLFGLTASKISLSPKEMALDQMPLRHVAQICAVIGLSPMVLGLPDPSRTYSNFAESNRAAYENALMPIQHRFAEAMNRFMPELVSDGERAQWDYSKVSYLQEDRGAKIHSLVEAVGGGILERNEARAELHYEPIEEPEPPVAPPVAPPVPAAPDEAQPADAKPAEDATRPEKPGPAAKAIVPTDAEIRLKTAAVLDALQARLGGVPPEAKYNPSHDRSGRFAAGRGGGRGVGGGSAASHPVPPVEAHEVAELRGKVEAHAKAGGGIGKVVVGPPLDRADEKVMEKAHEKGKVAVSVTARPILKTTRDGDSTTHTSRGSVTATVTKTDDGKWAVHNNTRTLVRGQLDLQPVGEHRTRRQAERQAKRIAGARVEEYTRVDRSGVSSLGKLKLGNKGSPQDATFTVRVLRPYGHELNGKADDLDGLEIQDRGPAEAKCDDDGACAECAAEPTPIVEADDPTPDGRPGPDPSTESESESESEPVESNGQPATP